MITTNIKLKGLTCSACQKVVEKRVKGIEGVEEVSVDLANGAVEIKGQRMIENQEIIKVLEGTDYKVAES